MRVVVSLFVLLSLFAQVIPAQAQTTPAPAFTVGANKVYAHASADSLQVWMNTLVDDGGGTPYYFFGAPAGTVPGVGAGYEFVQDADFEARIALTPALAQDLVLEGTVNVQAYIGGGTYTAGRATIGTSLVAGGAVLGSAAAKEHTMRPKQAGETYDAISWTFTVPRTAIPAGTVLEWVIAGNVVVGNNVYLGAHEARGRSNIELPITAATGGPSPSGSALQLHKLGGLAATILIDAGNATTARHQYNWTNQLTDPELRIVATVENGTIGVTVRGGNATLFQRTLTASGNLTDALTDAKAGNWSILLNLTAFKGTLNLAILEADAPPGVPGPSQTGTGSSGAPGSKGASGSAGQGGSGSSTTGKGTPGPAPLLVAGALLAISALARRRRA